MTAEHSRAAQNRNQTTRTMNRSGPVNGTSNRSDMQYVQDSYDAGSLVAAWLTPGTLGRLEPVLRHLLGGQQLFVKQPDGTYRPRGSQLGLARCFEFADLQGPALKPEGS